MKKRRIIKIFMDFGWTWLRRCYISTHVLVRVLCLAVREAGDSTAQWLRVARHSQTSIAQWFAPYAPGGTLLIFCHFGNFLPNLVALFGHINFTDHGSTSLNSFLTVLRRRNTFWLFLAFFGIFWQLLWPIFIPGQFVISPYSNIFWLVHLCDFGTFCTNLVALFGEFCHTW